MEQNNNIDKMLFDLLARFIKKEIITPVLLAMSKEYLIGKAPYLPFFKNTELYDTVLYLKEVMETNHIHNVSDLINYYNKKKKSLSIFIENALDKINEEIIDQYSFCDQITWEKNSSKKTMSILKNPVYSNLFQAYSSLNHHIPLTPMFIECITINRSDYIRPEDHNNEIENEVLNSDS